MGSNYIGLFLALILLTGCTIRRDETCLDGYLVSSFNNAAVGLFCENVYVGVEGIQGYRCSDIPFATPRLTAEVRIAEGSVFKTHCYNRLHGLKE